MHRLGMMGERLQIPLLWEDNREKIPENVKLTKRTFVLRPILHSQPLTEPHMITLTPTQG